MVQARDLRVRKDRAASSGFRDVLLRTDGFSLSVAVPRQWVASGRRCDVLLGRFLAAWDAARGVRFEAGRGSVRARVGARRVTAATPLADVVGDGEGAVDVDVDVGVERASPAAVGVGVGPAALEGGATAVVLTFVSGDYLPLLDLWLGRYASTAVGADRDARDLVVVAVDGAAAEGAAALLAARPALRGRVRAAPLDGGFDRRRLWAHRLSVIADVVAAQPPGAVVCHSDVDAFWVGDALAPALVALLRGGRLAAFSIDYGSRGAKQKAFALCPGFFAVRAGTAALAFLAAWAAATVAEGDDQNALNALFDAQLADRAWAATTPVGAERATRLPPRGPAAALAADVDVALLPYAAYARCHARHAPPPGSVPVLWHPWLDASRFPPAAKRRLWAAVLAELARGDTSILDRFYAAAPTATLTPRFLEPRRPAPTGAPPPREPSPESGTGT